MGCWRVDISMVCWLSGSSGLTDMKLVARSASLSRSGKGTQVIPEKC